MKFRSRLIKNKNGYEIYGPILIEPKIFEDTRGSFYESWNEEDWKQILNKFNQIYKPFLQDNHSKSIKGVLRGLHFQRDPLPQGKLVRCISGEIFDVAVDIRKNSESFGKWVGAYLNSINRNQLWIPEGFAHGFLTMSDYAEVNYKTTNFWNKHFEDCIIWNDKTINIDWPLLDLREASVTLSEKDLNAQKLDDLKLME
tara:strand:+ start:1703 stop:2299 length:597 start_codon:yes stop_codon:yes gene_type:complete